jgi:hypothetical protein
MLFLRIQTGTVAVGILRFLLHSCEKWTAKTVECCLACEASGRNRGVLPHL